MRVPGRLALLLLALLPAGGAARAAPGPVLPLFHRAPPAIASAPDAGPRAGLALRLDAEAVRALGAAGAGRVSLPLPDGAVATLALERFEALAPGAVVTVTGRAGPVPYRADVALFRGPLEGEPGSLAVLAIGGGEVAGWIERASGHLRLGRVPGADPAAHALVADDDAGPGSFECAADGLEDAGPAPPPALPARPLQAEAAATRLVCRVALDCDNEFLSKAGSDTSRAVRYALALLGTSSSIYEREIGVALQASYLNVWATTDPYTATGSSAALLEFRSWWQANRAGVSRDLATLLSGRDLGGGIAWLNALCSTSYGYSVLGNLAGTVTFPSAVTTWDVNVMAHELGHNFGSRHTHSCWWQANGYAPSGALLDSCQTAEDGSCAAGMDIHGPADLGTIMSYCHLLGGESLIRLDFHPACRTVMRYAAEHACFTAAPVQPPGDLAVAATPAGAALSWTASPTAGVLRYDVYRSPWPQDLAPPRIGSTAGTSFADLALGTFWYKVRAVRAADSSGFSGEVRAAVCAPAAAAAYATGPYPVAAAVADFDEDGLLDLAVTSFSGQTVSILRGRGSGGVPDGTFQPAATVPLPSGSYPSGLLASDLDGDGITDLAVAREEAASVIVLWGQGAAGVGDGTFAAGPVCAVGGGPWAVTDGDFDGDGILDLAVAGTAGVSVLLGRGTGGVSNRTFAPAASYSGGGADYAIATGDFDSDGITDLAVAGGIGASVMRGQGADGRGDGTFALPVSHACQSGPDAIATGDFDSDGITDLAVGNSSSGSVSVLLGHGAAGQGDGTFAAAVHFACGSQPDGLAAGDWNGDAVTDLAVSGAGGTVSILPGQAGGAFGAAQPFPAGAAVRALATGDFDGDGLADLVAVNNTAPGSVSVLLTTCPSPQPATLRVTEPSSAATWTTGTRHSIAWSRAPGVRAVDVAISRDGGANWQTLARAVTDTAWTWSAAGPFTAAARFRVQDPAVPAHAATSDSLVTIVPAGLLDAPPLAGPARLSLQGVRPNPARDRAEVWFTLAEAGPARLELLDPAGRRLRAMEVGGAAGPRRAEIAAVGALRPGLYLVRLTQNGRSATAKAVIAR